MLARPPASQSRNDKGCVGDRFLHSSAEIEGRSTGYQGSATMLSPRRLFVAFFLSVTVIAASTEADAQEQRRFAPPAPAADLRRLPLWSVPRRLRQWRSLPHR